MLSANHIESEGHPFADILHETTALQIGADTLLTFDANQRSLAEVEGLATPGTEQKSPNPKGISCHG